MTKKKKAGISAAIAVAIGAGIVSVNVPNQPDGRWLTWDYPVEGVPNATPLTNATFQLSYKTSLQGQWQPLTNVVGTNYAFVLNDIPVKLITITRVWNTDNTNNYKKLKGT